MVLTFGRWPFPTCLNFVNCMITFGVCNNLNLDETSGWLGGVWRVKTEEEAV